MTTPSIQKDTINACATETTKVIMKELDGDFFTILADESANISDKEQLALCLRYVNKRGEVMERFLGVVHVTNTTSLTLKEAIESYLMKHSLSFSRVRGQGYDGASNIFLRKKQAERVVAALSLGELESGTGLNQELSLSRPGDTRWGSHFKTILNVLNLYPTILESLDAIGDVSDSVDRNRAESLTHLLMSFDFIFVAHLMKSIFAITNELNLALQRSDQDIVNAMKMVDVTKINLQNLRNDGWDIHMSKVTLFAIKYGIETPDMEENYKNLKIGSMSLSVVVTIEDTTGTISLLVRDKQIEFLFRTTLPKIMNHYAQGSKIQASCRKGLIMQFTPSIKEGEFKQISNFLVRDNGALEKATNHNCVISLNYGSIIEECQVLDIPKFGFTFPKFDDIISKQLLDMYYIDVIRQLNGYSGITETAKSRMMTIELVDT
ncbi:uncharacterized protein LOC130590499 [Beta vulgaris subsp. vulgaris]|uniref:uncharacterized protein LOC130590499 n=1 Tax=Beta vulgaris subsp. vulgaris TaxID=3555 RepID=UPI0025492138|nr:uncharacterized protein LOC130590499 [Beta vulgaris subsp. vulgaris]